MHHVRYILTNFVKPNRPETYNNFGSGWNIFKSNGDTLWNIATAISR